MIEEVAKVREQERSSGGSRRNTAAIKKALKKGDLSTLVGFGTFNVKKRKAQFFAEEPSNR